MGTFRVGGFLHLQPCPGFSRLNSFVMMKIPYYSTLALSSCRCPAKAARSARCPALTQDTARNRRLTAQALCNIVQSSGRHDVGRGGDTVATYSEIELAAASSCSTRDLADELALRAARLRRDTRARPAVATASGDLSQARAAARQFSLPPRRR